MKKSKVYFGFLNGAVFFLKNTLLIILTIYLTTSGARAEIRGNVNINFDWLTKTDIINSNILNASTVLISGKDDHPFPYQILFRINLKSHTDFGVGVAVVFDTLLWVSAGGRTQLIEPNWVFIYNLNNQNIVDSFIQPTGADDWGWRDMCFDGQYVWASDRAQIDKINPLTHTVINSIEPPTGLNPHRGLASDYDSLYANNWDSPFWKFSFIGTNAHSFPNSQSDTIYGIAYDRQGFFWTSSQNVTGNRCSKYTADFNLIEEHAIAEIPGIAGGVEMWKDTILMYLSQADTDEVFAIQLYGINGVVNDAGIDIIHSPQAIIQPGAIITPMCRVRNFGSATQTNIPVTCWIDSVGTIIYIGTVNVDVNANDTVRATFSPDWTAGPTGNTYVVTMFTDLPGDENMRNDTLRRTSTTVAIAEDKKNKSDWKAFCSISPNPTKDFAQFSFSLAQPGNVSLQVFDLNGKIVRTLISDWLEPGKHFVKWNRTDNNGIRVVKGTYFYRLILDDKQSLGKAIIIK